MGFYLVNFRIGETWESGTPEQHLVHAVPFLAELNPRVNQTTVTDMWSNYPDTFNPNMWVFTDTAAHKTYLNNAGFNDVTVITAGMKIWLAVNRYISINSASMSTSSPVFTFYFDGTSFSIPSQRMYAAYAKTIPVPHYSSSSGGDVPYVISVAEGSSNYLISTMWNNCSGDGTALYNWWLGVSPVPDDPYGNLDVPISTHAGGDGIGYDNIINDDIDFPSTPTASAANANFISIWTPTLDQIQDLAKWMWTTDPLRWEFWQKLLQNPLELIFSLSIMPIPIHHTNDSSPATAEQLVALNDSLSLGWQDTGIGMDWVTEQYVEIDMGSINIDEVWGAFLDYEPYTKIDIFLPYIGMKTLDTNDCMPRTISLKYKIDLATGTCLALIKCDNSVYYHFSGNCASQIPITVNQCQEIVRGLMTMAVGATTVALGGVMAAGAHTSKAAITQGTAMKAGGSAMVGSGANNAAKGVNVSRSGTIGCAAGLMDVQTPYLVISRPRQALPEKQNTYTGYPSFITEQIGDLEGYTEVQIIHLENMTCTDEEYQEIDSLLLGGVII